MLKQQNSDTKNGRFKYFVSYKTLPYYCKIYYLYIECYGIDENNKNIRIKMYYVHRYNNCFGRSTQNILNYTLGFYSK